MRHFPFSNISLFISILILLSACNTAIPLPSTNASTEPSKTADVPFPAIVQTIPAIITPTILPTDDNQISTSITGDNSACTEIGQTWTSPKNGMVMNCVPAGEFLMGAAESDLQANGDEKPQHKVFLNAFWIDRTEITNIDLARCMAEDVCHPKYYDVSALTYTPYAIHPDFQDFPALIYEANDAETYCKWAGRRLPTEAEWEKAARGTDERIYPWGDNLDCSLANYLGCDNASKIDPKGPRCAYSGFCRTNRVDAFPAGASPYGVLNMAGNVWEWVSDWYAADYYASSSYANPVGPTSGEFKVRRGGGNSSISADLRVTARASGQGDHYFDGQMGFRCATSASVQ